MEVFQVIGIIVSALLIYAAITFGISFFISIIEEHCDGDMFWPIAWIVGGIGFAAVSYCWITGVPLPVLK